MRSLVFLFALSASATSAQPEVPRSMGTGQNVLALHGGAGAGYLGAVAVGLLTNRLGASPDAALITGIVAYPLVTAAATYGLGRAFGADGTLRGTLVGAAIGASAGAGLAYLAGNLAARNVECPTPDDYDDLFGCALEGLGVLAAMIVPYALGPPIGAVVGFNVSVQPSAAVGPDGETALGFALRVGL